VASPRDESDEWYIGNRPPSSFPPLMRLSSLHLPPPFPLTGPKSLMLGTAMPPNSVLSFFRLSVPPGVVEVLGGSYFIGF